MAPKKRKSENGDSKSGREAKQQTLLRFPTAKPAAGPSSGSAGAQPSSAAAAQPAKRGPVQMYDYNVLPCLDRALQHDVERAAEEYKAKWGSKCTQQATSISRDKGQEMDLDEEALVYLELFRKAFQLARRRGAVLQRELLEVLVLVVRNDVVHKHPHPSRQAYGLLQEYLRQFPAVTLAVNEDTSKPYILTSVQRLPGQTSALPHERNKHTDSFWSGLEDSLTSFSSTYLLVTDMEASGRKYKSAQANVPQHRQEKVDKLGGFDLLLHLFHLADKSDKVNRDGDLMLLRYLLAVVEQDLRCRLAVFSAYEEEGDEDDSVQQQRLTLLKMSLLWRMQEYIDNHTKLEMVKVLMRLICAASSRGVLGAAQPGSGGGSGSDEEELEDADEVMAAAAEASIFTRQELGALAAQMLRLQLELMGAVESAKGFKSTSKARASGTNYRTQLEECMLKCFWGDLSVCRNDELSRTFLRCLPPRDRLRFLGMLIAEKFRRTYDLEAKGGLGELLAAGDSRGADWDRYKDVNMLQAVQSINLDHARAMKVYKNINLLSVVVSNIALALHALTATSPGLLSPLPGGGQDQPGRYVLGASLADLCAELHTALKGIAQRALDPKDGTQRLVGPCRVELVHAQMAIAALA